MTHSNLPQRNPKLDLSFERIVDVPADLVWTAWTKPEHVKKWFTPAPWSTVDCEIDLRPGGIFRTVMQSPEGYQSPNVGCYLDIIENEKLVWTSALGPGYRPAKRPVATNGHDCVELFFTAAILLESQGNKTKYTTLVMHEDEESRKKHEEMGFHEGWGAALDQLIALAKTM